ncbi:MBL fold metallo-hydrolase [bacterium]|nr:MBL fold metallo-hydrolase [bacterium]
MFDFKKNGLCYIKGGRYPHCHALFIDDHLRVLIDPACDDRVLKRLASEKPIDVIINSHCHEDHFLNNYLFPEAELWVHEKEAPMFRSIETLLDSWLDDDEKTGPKGDETLQFLINDVHFKEREPDRLLLDRELISFGDTQMQVLHTPGHSPGHLSFFFPNEKVLYTADLDLVEAGPYYGDKASDIDEMIHSLERLLEIKAETYLSAHGKYGIYAGDPKYILRYIDVIYQRENRLLDALTQKPSTLEEIADFGIIHGKKKISGAWDLSLSEKKMMAKHLVRLIRKGAVQQEGDRYIAC